MHVSAEICMCVYGNYRWGRRWNMCRVLIMHCQGTHVAADDLTAQVELAHLGCTEVRCGLTPWDLLSAGSVWDPAQIMSVGIWTNLVAYGGRCLMWEMEFILAGNQAGRFHSYSFRGGGSLVKGFRIWGTKLQPKEDFSPFCLLEECSLGNSPGNSPGPSWTHQQRGRRSIRGGRRHVRHKAFND